MEKERGEWEIVEYYPAARLDEDRESDDKSNKWLGWVIDTGASVGKKLVITGFVISSAPVVLPPLFVISALGFAFSVPFGVVFASYAGAQTLMSKLLPPSPDLSFEDMLDYQTSAGPLINEADQEPVVVAIDDEKEEKEQKQAAIKDIEIEMRLQKLVDNIEYVDDDAGVRDEQKSLAYRDKSDKDSSPTNVEVGVLANNEERDHQRPSEQVEDDENVLKTVVASELTITGNRKSEGNIHNVGSRGGDARFNVQFQTDKFMENQDAVNLKGRENFLPDKNEQVDKTITEMERTKDKTFPKEIERRGKKKTLAAFKFPAKKKSEPEGDKRQIGKEQELPKGTNTSSDNNVKGELGPSDKLDTKETSVNELGSVASDKKQGEKECILLGIEDYDNKQILPDDGIGNTDTSLDKEEKRAGSKDGAAVETAQRGSANESVVDKEIEHCVMTVHGVPGENHNDSGTIAAAAAAADDYYSLDVAALAGIPELKPDDEIRHLKDEKDVVESVLHPDKEFSRDEMVWEKIDAIRAIVGLRAPRLPSYIEELKALYLFTGIEPPSTTTDPCDTADFYNKLSFLMSVIGLK